MPLHIDLDIQRREAVPHQFTLTLLKPDNTPFGTLQGVTDLEFDFRMDSISTLSLTLSKYITRRHKKILNPAWDYILNGYLIAVDDVQTFVIDTPELSADDAVVKNITAYALENEIISKLVRNYKSTINDEAVPVKLLTAKKNGILDITLNEQLHNSWKIGHVDADVLTRVRLVPDTPEQNLYDFYKQIQQSFHCLFRYDTGLDENGVPKRVINIYDAAIYTECPHCHHDIYYDEGYIRCTNSECGANAGGGWVKAIYGEDSGLRLTDRNYIQSYTEKLNKVVTRLYVKGKDDLDIIYAHPLGQDYVEDLSYYRNGEYMSALLLEALDSYDESITENQTSIVGLQKDIDNLNITISNLTYGTENIAAALAELQGYLNDSITALNDWKTGGKQEDLNNANNLLNKIDTWINDHENDLDTYGQVHLERLYKVYEQRINAIMEVNKNLKLNGNTLVPKTPAEEISLVNDAIDLESYKEIKKKISDALNSVNQDISANTIALNGKKSELENLRQKLGWDTFLNKKYPQNAQTLLDEYNKFIVEETYTNNDIGTAAVIGSKEYQNAVKDLYEDGLRALKTYSVPKVEISTDVLDFLDSAACVYDWGKLGLGNIITVDHPDRLHRDGLFDRMVFRIIGIQYSPYDKKLRLDISNEENLKSAKTQMADILKGAAASTGIVSANQGKWNTAKDNAVTTMIEQGLDLARSTVRWADNQNTLLDNRGLTMGSLLDAEKARQVRLMNTGLYITTDDWQKVRTALTADGLIADTVIGRLLIGNSLYLEAQKTGENSTSTYCRFDANGLQILNSSLSVCNSLGDGGKADFTGKGFFVKPNDGVLVRGTNEGNIYEVVINPNTNKIFDIHSSEKDYLYFDTSAAELVVNGKILAQSLFLGADKKNIIEYCGEDKKYKISGEFINGRGLRAYDHSGDLRVQIDGDNGGISIYDGYIYMINGQNEIKLNPDTGLTFTSNNHKKLKLDITTGNVTLGEGATITAPKISGGEIAGGIFRATGQGRNNETAYYIQNGNIQCGYISYDNNGAGTEDEARERVFFTTVNNVALKIQSAGNLSLSAGNNGKKTVYISSDTEISGELKVNNEIAATQNYVDDKIDELRSWVNNNFAKKSDIPSTT